MQERHLTSVEIQQQIYYNQNYEAYCEAYGSLCRVGINTHENNKVLIDYFWYMKYRIDTLLYFERAGFLNQDNFTFLMECYNGFVKLLQQLDKSNVCTKENITLILNHKHVIVQLSEVFQYLYSKNLCDEKNVSVILECKKNEISQLLQLLLEVEDQSDFDQVIAHFKNIMNITNEKDAKSMPEARVSLPLPKAEVPFSFVNAPVMFQPAHVVGFIISFPVQTLIVESAPQVRQYY